MLIARCGGQDEFSFLHVVYFVDLGLQRVALSECADVDLRSRNIDRTIMAGKIGALLKIEHLSV